MKNSIKKWTFVAVGLMLMMPSAFAALSVMTTTSDLRAIVERVGGKYVEAEAFCRGTQDPHFIEPKPSYMVKASRADLVVSIGLGLEIGWLPSILQGGRNPKIMPGQSGNLEVGPSIGVIEVPDGKVSRAQGDVHPEGNPHITLDPIRDGQIAQLIAKRLALLDAAHAGEFATNANTFQKSLEEKTKLWQARLTKSGIKKIITHHKTLDYFADRFHIEIPAILEPLPGVPPTAKHTIEVIDVARAQGVKLVMVENFFESSVADRIAKDVPGLRVVSTPVAVDGVPQIKSLEQLFEHLVAIFEGKS